MDEEPPVPSPKITRTKCPEGSGLDLCFTEEASWALTQWLDKLDSYAHHAFVMCGPGTGDHQNDAGVSPALKGRSI